MSLEDDLRHSDRNDAARQRSADQLRNAFRLLLAQELELEQRELPEWRDSTKATMQERKRRAERKNATILEAVKWAVGAAGGALLTWLSIHGQGGGK